MAERLFFNPQEDNYLIPSHTLGIQVGDTFIFYFEEKNRI